MVILSFILLSFSGPLSVSTPSIACIGGLIVFWGLWIEKNAEEEDHLSASRFAKAIRLTRLKSQVGWWILMAGISVEIGDAAWTAWDISETKKMVKRNDPHNLPIVKLSAHAVIKVRPTPLMNLGNRARINGGNNLTIVEKGIQSVAGDADLLLGKYSQFNRSRWHAMLTIYGEINSVMRDESDGALRFDLSFNADDSRLWNRNNLIVSELDCLSVRVPSMWGFSGEAIEVVGGEVTMTINSSLIKEFKIPPQTNWTGWASSVNSNGVFTPMDLHFWVPQ